jgi:hypothetical protein
MKTNTASTARICLLLLLMSFLFPLLPGRASGEGLWKLAQEQKEVHRFSTLFTAQDIRDSLSNPEGIEKALLWCKKTGVTKVYVEEFRDGYQAKREAILRVKKRFVAEGFAVAGCVTTTNVGKPSTGWKDVISCYTDLETQEKVRAIFEYAASLFDEVMIDDFWFTDCACRECDTARKSRTVRIGNRSYPVPGDSWSDYRSELMVQLSREYALGAARRVNPRVRLIIKYPQWYDQFHERGYEVVRQTGDFDRIWVGTETRDYGDKEWGGTVQYEAFFIMRWLGGVGSEKCGGGWYDWLGTTEKTYVEQARQTILGGARESMLFCYGGLQGETGPRNVEVLRSHIPELLKVAAEVKSRKLVGIAAYKPPNSEPGGEARVFDFIGMMGLPLVPCHEFPTEAPAVFLSVHALKDPGLVEKLSRLIQSGKPVLITDGLAKRLAGKVDLDRPNVLQLKVNGAPASLLNLSGSEIDSLRVRLLRPFETGFQAPNRTALYLFDDGSWVVENFNDEPAQARLNGETVSIPPRGWVCRWKGAGS